MDKLNILLGIVMLISFAVNIIVQLTKGFVPIPTKLWAIIVSEFVMVAVMYIGATYGAVQFDFAVIVASLLGSFIVAYIAMYGFDTLKDLWQRFEKGENINE